MPMPICATNNRLMTVSPAMLAVEKRHGGYIPKDRPDHGARRFDPAGDACYDSG